jgi:hydroxymethylglutaryl-CoA synthase
MAGIVSYGAYVPYFRLQRSSIAATLGSGGGKGTRSVASYDEDPTSMGVEAARAALGTAGDVTPSTLYFATAVPPYLDKSNANAVHAALGLAPGVFAGDVGGSVRSGVAALRAATDASTPTLAVLSDIRTGLPGGADERDGGDAAAAFLFGSGDGVVAELVGTGSATGEFLERWRLPGEATSHSWEERFGEHVYVPLAQQALATATASAGLAVAEVDRLIVTGTHGRSVRQVVKLAAVTPEVLVDDLAGVVGNSGTAHPALLLASALDDAQPGQLIALVVLADGADVLLFRTTDAISGYRPRTTVQDLLASTRDDLDYARFLSWRGMLHREPPRRPEPARPAGPPALRTEGWKFRFEASRCEACGARNLPPQRVCVDCGAVDRMAREGLANVRATVATFTVDHLQFSLNPPVVAAVVDFDGGGRFQCELTDVDAETIAIGDRVEMTFRCLYTADGVHNYFWKARPLREAS